MYVKICGLRDAATAAHAAKAGADAVGVVFSERSPRHATPDEARAVITAARAENPDIDTVLVVREMSADAAARAARDLGFDVLQLHGGYDAEDFARAKAILPRVWRATSLEAHPDLTAGAWGEERLLVDGARAGSGESWDLSLLEQATLGDRWLLAGGLSPDTVTRAITEARPAGVDVSSGVESAPGAKSLELITRFLRAARPA